MKVFSAPFRERIEIEGIMPERALLRLKRAKIPLFNVKKTEKTRIRLSVKKKDIEKVFAIYPNVCYNSTAYRPYTVRKLGGEGAARIADKLTKRIGLLLGGLLFMGATLFFDGFVFGVEIVGASAYTREVYEAIEESGVKLFSPYRTGKEDLVSAKLLSLDGIEFCSVKKVGGRLRVELRLSPFSKDTLFCGVMTAKSEGRIVDITVLRGSALKKIGDEVRVGDALVGDWFCTEEGEQVRVQPIARVRIACTYEGVIEAEDGEAAFAKAYLLTKADGERITEKKIEKEGEGYRVTLAYTVTETVNL